jgi:PIN domain nuclease of toxin-antitoxin system
VRLLLDTHSFLWFVLDDPQLSNTAKAAIEDPANESELSPASYWEIAIKIALETMFCPSHISRSWNDRSRRINFALCQLRFGIQRFLQRCRIITGILLIGCSSRRLCPRESPS